MNEYNNPSFATMFQRALVNTCITTCFGLNPSHHQVLSYTEYKMQAMVRVLGYRSGGPGSIPGTTKKKVVGLERVHSAS
jgi:hypothetical protein